MNSVEPQVSWSQDKMIEVSLDEPDDFLKVRETLTRIGVASRISKESITLFTLRNCLLWMANMQISL